jgi:hypothetical protein
LIDAATPSGPVELTVVLMVVVVVVVVVKSDKGQAERVGQGGTK